MDLSCRLQQKEAFPAPELAIQGAIWEELKPSPCGLADVPDGRARWTVWDPGVFAMARH